MTKNLRLVAAFIAVGALTSSLSGCSVATESAGTGASTSAVTMAESVTISDVWVKSVEDVSGVMPMTGYFMLVTNDSDADVTIVGGTAPTDVTMEPVETHEVVKNDSGEMVMREAVGGITIPARGSVKLMPGGYHLMLMSLMSPILAGDDLAITVEFADGSTVDVTGVAYTIENGIEKYSPEAGM